MKYTQAREIVESALDALLNEGMMPSSMEKSKPSMRTVKKPTSPSPSSNTPRSPAVKMGERNTNARWRRGNRWALRQIAKNKQASAVNEESEKEMSARNIKTYQGHIDRLEGAIKHHSSRKPGWSDRYGSNTQSNINTKVKDLTNIHKELTTRHKKALENHASGNYGANRGHYLLNTDWH
jgi:hypothetical protein